MITLFFVVVTTVFSIMAFNNRSLYYQYMFNAYEVAHRKKYVRLFSHALLHGSWEHLIINMLVLFSFGAALEEKFRFFYPDKSTALLFGLLYVSAVVVSSLYSLYEHQNNSSYNAVGASGAVSAVVFADIFFDPLSSVYFFGILPLPGILFGALYLGYSYYMGKRNMDNIGHDAHFYGAVYGFIFPMFINFRSYEIFLNNLFG